MKISLNNLVSGSAYDGKDWRDLTDEEYEKASRAIRNFLLSYCRRGNMMNTISRINFYHRANYGIYERLQYDTVKDQTDYTAGQDYSAEIKCIKQLLTK